jgi:hypothetical protein
VPQLMIPDDGVEGPEYLLHAAVHVVADEGNEMRQRFCHDSVISQKWMTSGWAFEAVILQVQSHYGQHDNHHLLGLVVKQGVE